MTHEEALALVTKRNAEIQERLGPDWLQDPFAVFPAQVAVWRAFPPDRRGQGRWVFHFNLRCGRCIRGGCSQKPIDTVPVDLRGWEPEALVGVMTLAESGHPWEEVPSTPCEHLLAAIEKLKEAP